MSINTLDLNEINQDRAAEREALAAARPTTQPRKRKWRDIESLKDSMALAKLLRDDVAIGY